MITPIMPEGAPKFYLAHKVETVSGWYKVAWASWLRELETDSQIAEAAKQAARRK